MADTGSPAGEIAFNLIQSALSIAECGGHYRRETGQFIL